jgi:hypothetical protein
MIQLDLREIDHRIQVFVDYFIANVSPDPDRNLAALQAKYQTLTAPEERLFFILLTTHFDSLYLADEFHQRLSWNKIQQVNEIDIWQVCKEYIYEKQFTGKYLIGDHRRYFRCLPKDGKVDYSSKILTSYKQTIGRYSSQAAFFEIDNEKAKFDVLYQKMKKIACFHPRLPRFDHLERVSRLHNFYVVPDRFYAEDATGPLYGLTCLLFGKRLGKDSGITKQYLVKSFPQIWNEQIGGAYVIPDGADFKQIIACLEQWVVKRVRNWETLPSVRQHDKAFVFDIESCLCNWQKGKCLDDS